MSVRTALATWLVGLGQPPEVKRLMSDTLATFDTVTAGEWYARNGYYPEQSGGRSTYTGKTVNQETALELPAIYAGVRMISEDMGSLPRHVYRYSADWSATEKARDLRLYRIMHDLWNPDVSAGEAVEALTAHAILAGHGIAQIQRSTTNLRKTEAVYLWPWVPSECQLDRDKQGRRVYLHKEDTQWVPYQREDVFHVKGFTFTGFEGDDRIARAAQSLGLGLGQQEFAGRYFANGIHSDLFLEVPAGTSGRDLKTTTDRIRNLKKAFLKKVGLGHVAEPFVLADGIKANRQPVDMEKAQLVQQDQRSVLNACRLLRIPPHKLAELDRAIQSNIVEQSIDYIVYTLTPWNRRWKEAFYRCLLTIDEQLAGQLYMEHDFAGLLRGDFAQQSEGFRAMLEKGVYSINEVRRILNYNPVPGGDEHYIQLNMQAVGQAAASASGEMTSETVARMLRAKPDELKSIEQLEGEIDLAIGGLYRVRG